MPLHTFSSPPEIQIKDIHAAFGRYPATVKATGIRDGKVARYFNVTNSGAFIQASRAFVASR